jgi:hypothetical protein
VGRRDVDDERAVAPEAEPDARGRLRRQPRGQDAAGRREVEAEPEVLGGLRQAAEVAVPVAQPAPRLVSHRLQQLELPGPGAEDGPW